MFANLNLHTLDELRHILGALDWDEVRGQVDTEGRARIALIGLGNVGKSSLFNRLKGWAVSPAATKLGHTAEIVTEDLGLFVLIDTPAFNGGDELTTCGVLEANLIILVLDATVGLRASEYEWFGRLRAWGKPVVVVLNKIDQAPGPVEAQVEALSAQLASRVIPVSAATGENIATRLVPYILDAYPALAVPLGRELLAFRRQTAGRVIRQTSTFNALIGAEPIPLLDIPFQIMTQMRMVLRLAAIYGEPMTDRHGLELVATIAGGGLLRYTAQQAAKAVPVLGWAVSGGLAAASTWSLGQAARLYFENGKHLRPAHPRQTLQALGQGAGRRAQALGQRTRALPRSAWQRLRHRRQSHHPIIIEAIGKHDP